MSLDLDTLKNHDSTHVIINNSTGLIVEFYGIGSFIEVLNTHFKVKFEEIKKYFSYDEVEDFIMNETDMEMDEERLKLIFGEEGKR